MHTEPTAASLTLHYTYIEEKSDLNYDACALELVLAMPHRQLSFCWVSHRAVDLYVGT
jgi:hypothetical protein